MRAFLSKWGVCLLLFLATTLNYLDRQTLSILAPALQAEMHLDNEALGWLFSVFYYSYTFAQFAVGFLLDRWNLRWAFGLAVLAWSLVSALTGLATGFAGLIVFRLLLGVAESPNWPGALRIVARALPPAERAIGSGIFTSGSSVGALIAPGLILGISSALGWRWAFVAVGLLGLVWFAAWLPLTRGSELTAVWRDQPLKSTAAPARRDNVYTELLRGGRFWRVWLVAVLVNPCLYFSVNWLPTYFAQQWGLHAGRELGWVLTVIYIGLDLGYLACGAGVLSFTRLGCSLPTARRITFVCATILAALCGLVPLTSSLRGAVTILVVVNFGIGIWIATYLTMAQEISSARISTAAGLLGGSASLIGALAMWAVGRVTKTTGDFSLPMAAVTVAFVLAAVTGWAVTRPPVAKMEEVAA